MPPARYALTPLYGGRGGWGHCVLKHTAGPLSDKGGGVQCRLPRIIPTNKHDTNTCQHEVKHVGEHSKKQRSCIDAIRKWMRLQHSADSFCVELHSTLGRRGSGHWSIKLPRDDRHNPDWLCFFTPRVQPTCCMHSRLSITAHRVRLRVRRPLRQHRP